MTDNLHSLQNSLKPETSFTKHTSGLVVGSNFAIITDLSIILNRNCTFFISYLPAPLLKKKKKKFSYKRFGPMCILIRED